MNHIHLDTIQRFVEKLLDHTACEAKLLGIGATSTAWSLSCGSDQYIVRVVYASTNRPITYRSEFVILQRLYKLGLPVPEPLHHSFEQPYFLGEGISAWAITRLIPGKPILKNRLTATAAVQLGAFLKALHQLPCSNFGRLNENSERLEGQQTTAIEGIRGRWCWAQLWPFDNTLLSKHPIATLAPDLLNVLTAIEPKLWRIPAETESVLNHSDLHGEHIFITDQTLSGVIDFGAVCIATPGWDFAVLAYYHGWEAVKAILNGYTQVEPQRRHLLNESRYLAVVVGLYKLQKAVVAKSETTRQQQITRFLVETLSLLP
jgi:aminoglycoside phosphotransferase (APT) family kinase protein